MHYLLSVAPIFSNFRVGPIILTDFLVLFIALLTIFKSQRSIKKVELGLVLAFIATYIVITISIFFSSENLEALLSRVRFIQGIFFFSVCMLWLEPLKKSQLKVSYINVVAASSLFLILQVIVYYSLSYTIPFSFGSFTLSESSIYDKSLNYIGIMRTGGFFREPSFFALFVFPSLFILDSLNANERRYMWFSYNNIKILIILALLLSTSGLGILAILFYALSTSLISVRSLLIMLVLLILIVIFTFFLLPETFSRIDHLITKGGSSKVRVFVPLEKLYHHLGDNFFGNDALVVYDTSSEASWVNSLVFIFFMFGSFGLSMFILFLLLNLSLFYFSVVMAITLIEGAAGRYDYWFILVLFTLLSNQPNHKTIKRIIA